MSQVSGNRKCRVAVVGGTGNWGRHYMRAFAARDDCEIVALVDRARDRRQAFADHYGIKAVFDTVDQLLAEDVPDVVSIVVPVESNPGAVIACAEAGVKVISCEKPIAVSLHEADEMVHICKERGAALGCGTAYWGLPHLLDTVGWVRAGNLGRLTQAAMPFGLQDEVSGGGCHHLTMMRLLTGMEVEWVEGWSVPPDPNWTFPPDAKEEEKDSGASGRMGLSGGIICEVPYSGPRGRGRGRCFASVTGENGHVYLCGPRPVIISGHSALASPVTPRFPETTGDLHWGPAIGRLVRAFQSGDKEVECSGHDYRQALEIAIAFKLSAHHGHQRTHLPLEDRSLRIFPQPYRLVGGDVAGWIGGKPPGPPESDWAEEKSAPSTGHPSRPWRE